MDNQNPVNMDLSPSATGGVAQKPTIIDQLTPTQIYFGKQLATNSQAMSRAADYLPLFSQGVDPMEIYNRERTAQQSEGIASSLMGFKKNAEMFAEDTKDLPDAEYEQAKQQFVDAQSKFVAEQNNIPQREQVKPKAPNALSLGLALFGAAMNPRFASNILAAPFEASLAVKGMKQNEADQKYDDELSKHRERLQILGTVAQQALKDVDALRAQQGDNAKRLASAIGKMLTANKPGEASIALQEAIAAGLPKDRVQAYGVMVDAREKALEAEAAKASKKADLELENAQALLDDRKNAPAKEAEAKATKAIDDFRQWVSVQYPADRALGKTEIEAINKERNRRAKATGVPIDRFDVFGERGPSMSQEFQQQKYKEEAPARQQEYANKVLEGQIKEVDLAKKRREFAEGPPSKDKAARGKKLASLNTRIENAKIEVDAILQQPAPEDPDERAKYFAKLRDAFATETAIVQLKRKAMGGKVPTLGDYLQERFPGAVPKLFGIIDAAAPGTTGKVMSDKEKRRLGKGGSATPVIPGLPGVTKAG